MASFEVIISVQGKSICLNNVTTSTTQKELSERVKEAVLDAHTGSSLKILLKGKTLDATSSSTVFPTTPRKTPKLLVLVSSPAAIQQIQDKRSDPTIRGFDSPNSSPNQPPLSVWGPDGRQDRNYKFVRLQVCQDLQDRISQTPGAPHMFDAMRLLEQLSTDPGIVAVLRERQLVVNTLGEMDPVDDRLQQKTNGCLLGYNTNRGLRIDVRLRAPSLQFLPYRDVVATLLHEISHNWFGDHDLYFWTNYGQMRAEYLFEHYHRRSSIVWNGQTSAQIAQLTPLSTNTMGSKILQELQSEMAQHGLHPDSIAPAILQRCQELEQANQNTLAGGTTTSKKSARELALQAAERRRQQNDDAPEKQK